MIDRAPSSVAHREVRQLPIDLPFLDCKCVMAVALVSKVQLYQWIKEGNFPAPFRLGKARVGWKKSEVDAWVASRPRTFSQARTKS
jgi:prophage regulatory protein